MLLPHFSQVWYFWTPATDDTGFGGIGDNFPGNINAPSVLKTKQLNLKPEILDCTYTSGVHW